MCRNIRTLFNFEPPATDEEIRASALQFVRKVSGFTHPSKSNEAAFNRAVTCPASRDAGDAYVAHATFLQVVELTAGGVVAQFEIR